MKDLKGSMLNGAALCSAVPSSVSGPHADYHDRLHGIIHPIGSGIVTNDLDLPNPQAFIPIRKVLQEYEDSARGSGQNS